MKNVLLFLLLFMFPFVSNSQVVTLQLKPGAAQGKDAYLADFGATTNYGQHPEYAGFGWTCGGNPCVGRGVLEFDLSSIPLGSTIVDARLNLYANTSPVNGNGQSMFGSNASRIYRVTSPWNESTVTYNNQPTYTTTNGALLFPSSISFQNYININVTSLVSVMTSAPGLNNGFLLKLVNESPLSSMIFASSDFSNPTLWPELIVQYTVVADSCITLSAMDAFASDSYLASVAPSTNYGSHPEFSGFSWTCQGSPCFGRGLLNFDFSTIPPGAIINSAELNLYANPSPVNGIIAMQGSNASILQRVVTPWTENGVTWNSQPNTTSVNAVTLTQSVSSSQNYLGINVLPLITDIVNNPSTSYGIMLKLINEVGLTSMTFAASDYGNPGLSPTLDICYTTVTGIEYSVFNESQVLSLFPNPSSNEEVTVLFNPGQSKKIIFQLFDLNGKVLQSWSESSKFSKGQKVSLSLKNIESGLYLLKVIFDDRTELKKLIVTSPR
ncbi:MAG: DNRLRE domain-containing protein [Bacteroidia bacterium]